MWAKGHLRINPRKPNLNDVKQLASVILSFAICPLVQAQSASSGNDRHLQSGYIVNRDLNEYSSAYLLGDGFAAELKRLNSGQHWIDVGAGKAEAAIDYLSAGGPAQVTALSVEPYDTPRLKEALRRNRLRFRYLSGRVIEDYAMNELGHADIISDVYGAFSYAPHIDKVLIKFSELLRKDGKIFIALNGEDANINILGASLLCWLSAVQGMTVVNVNEHVRGWSTVLSIILRKDSENVVVPALELLRFDDGNPPVRVYRWNTRQCP